MSERTSQLNELPDLPGLESVEVRSWNILAVMGGFVCFYFLLPMPFLLWSFLHYRRYLPDGVGWLLGIYAALGAWVVFRMLSANYHFRVDRTGVMVRGVFTRRSVEWNEVTDAEMTDGLSGEVSIRLRSRSGDLVVGPGLKSAGSDRFLASIWQHLRQIGKADQVEPTTRALSFWDTIPDELPLELQWGKPPSRAQWLGPVLMFLFLGALPAALWLDPPARWSGRVFFGFITLAALIMLMVVVREWANEAKRVVLRDNELEVQTVVRTLRLPWSEVDYADRGGMGVLIGAGKLRVNVPCIVGKEDSERLVLGIIRRLRTAGTPQAIIIPDNLRTLAPVAPRDAHGSLQPVELRVSAYDTLGVFVVVGFFYLPASMAVLQGVHARWLAAAALAVGAVVVGLFTRCAARSYSLRADDEGITRAFLGSRRLVRWEEVAACKPSSVPKERMRGRKVLKNAKGRTLTDFPPGFGTARDRAAFTAFVEAKLSQILPNETAKPWLARPFSLPKP